jgi:hypothetical protein
LILPDTEETGAKNVIARLKDYLGGLKQSKVGDLALQNGFFSTIEYPRTMGRKMSLEMEEHPREQWTLEHRKKGLTLWL